MIVGDRVMLVDRDHTGRVYETTCTGVVVAVGVSKIRRGKARWYKVRWDAGVNLDEAWCHHSSLVLTDVQ